MTWLVWPGWYTRADGRLLILARRRGGVGAPPSSSVPPVGGFMSLRVPKRPRVRTVLPLAAAVVVVGVALTVGPPAGAALQPAADSPAAQYQVFGPKTWTDA